MDSLLMLAAGGCCRSTHWLLIDATQRKHGALHLHRSQSYTIAIGACHVCWQQGHGVVLSRHAEMLSQTECWEPIWFRLWQSSLFLFVWGPGIVRKNADGSIHIAKAPTACCQLATSA